MIKKLSCVSHGSLKRFPHTFTTIKDTIEDWDIICLGDMYEF